MSTVWDINRLRKTAGLQIQESAKTNAKPLTEGRWDDDDVEYDDPDVAVVSKDKGQREFEARNKKHLDDNAAMLKKRAADQKAATAAKKEAAKKEEPKSEPKAEPEKKAEPAKEEPKKEESKSTEPAAKSDEAAPEAKRRGRAPSEDSKSGQARAWLTNNAGARRGEFIAHAGQHFQMSKHHANTFYYAHKAKNKKDVSECFVLVHPFMSSLVLAENREMGTMQWIDPSSDLEPKIFFERAEAEKLAEYMADWKNQATVIEKIDLTQ